MGNEFCIDLTLCLSDVSEAMRCDSLAHTVNYAEVVSIVRQQMSVSSCLLENVAARIRDAIMGKYGEKIYGGKVRVAKLAPPIPAQLDYVAFTTEW